MWAAFNFFAFSLSTAIAIAGLLSFAGLAEFSGRAAEAIEYESAFMFALYGWVETLPLPFRPADPYSTFEVLGLNAIMLLTPPVFGLMLEKIASSDRFISTYSWFFSWVVLVSLFGIAIIWYYVDIPEENPVIVATYFLAALAILAVRMPKAYLPNLFGALLLLAFAGFVGDVAFKVPANKPTPTTAVST